jgi:hypothetical protein
MRHPGPVVALVLLTTAILTGRAQTSAFTRNRTGPRQVKTAPAGGPAPPTGG